MNRSMEAITWAMHARGINPIAWKVLVRGLCARVNNERGDFDVWPSHLMIAEDCEISPSSVKRHLLELEQAGIIQKLPRWRENGGTTSNCYRLMVRTKHFMPTGTVDVDARKVGQADLGVGVNLTQGVGQADLGAQVTADLCKEPVKEGTYPTGTVIPPPTDLFGKPLLTDDQIAQEQRDTLIGSIEQRWHALAKANPVVSDIVAIHDRRRELVFKLIDKHAAYGSAVEIWDKIFERIAESRLLRGLTKPSGDREEPWAATFDWLLSKDPKTRVFNMMKVLEGNYRDKRADHAGFDPATGRKLTGIEEAGRNVDRRLRESRDRALGGGDPGGHPDAGPQRPVRRRYGRAPGALIV